MSPEIGREYRVILAVNQPLIEAGICSFLADHPFLRIDNQSGNINVLESIRSLQPDLLIIDYTTTGSVSLDALETLLAENKDLKVLVVSSDEDKDAILRSVRLGIMGYVTRECGTNEFILAAESAARGAKFFCSKILDIIINKNTAEEQVRPGSVLTVREQEILKLLAEGHSTQRIADLLHLSPHTVQTHRKSIIRKLKIKSPTQFVIYALDMGLIKPVSPG